MTQNILTPDPEETPEEAAELTYRLQEAMHRFVSDDGFGPCQEAVRKYCYEHKRIDYHQKCGLPTYSVLHTWEENSRHDSECYCYSCSQ